MAEGAEGHAYRGPITWGAWVDARDLEPGYRLLNDDKTWAEAVPIHASARTPFRYCAALSEWMRPLR